jgi:hypothetical protein
VTVCDGLGADAVADGFDDPLVIFFLYCFAKNVIDPLHQVYCEAEHAVHLWLVPVGCTAQAVCDVVCLPRLPLQVEVLDGEVLAPLLASCVANFVNLFTPNSKQRPMVGPDGELLHAEQVVSALFDRVLDCKCFEFY